MDSTHSNGYCPIFETYNPNNAEIESETHLLLSCSMYNKLRSRWSEKLHSTVNFDMLSAIDELDVALNPLKIVRQTPQFVIKAMDLGSLLTHTILI